MTRLADGVVGRLKTLRLPCMRRIAPDLPAAAKAQRWDPAEAVEALLEEEIAGRAASSAGAGMKCSILLEPPRQKTRPPPSSMRHRSMTTLVLPPRTRTP